MSIRRLGRKFTTMIKATPASNPRIGIIGAGLTGLRCADVLLQHGFDVTIIEGRDRVGGRVHQRQLPNGRSIDLGPNWIHGTVNNPILDLARQTGTETASMDADGSYVFDDAGELVDNDLSDRLTSVMWGIVEDAFEHSKKHAADINERESLHDFFIRKVIKEIPDAEEGHQRKREAVMQASELWGAYVGSSVREQTLKFFWMEDCIAGENLFCAGTYEKILALVAKPALAGADIRLRTRAAKIIYGQKQNSTTKVQISGGQTLDFDAVVVTSPLGWLQQHMGAFEPPLPARLSQAIKSIGYGCLEKVYITFPEAFWASSAESNRKAEGFIQWLTPKYAPNTNPERWGQEGVEMASLPPSSSHPTLLFYVFGDQSRYLTSHSLGLSTKGDKEAFLANHFEPYYSRLPFYDPADERCRPSSCVATDWLHDDLAGNGSYSCFRVGLKDADGDVKAMRDGLPDQGLWFAGEHTAAFEALGTTTGAYSSGEAVARRIALRFGSTSNGEGQTLTN